MNNYFLDAMIQRQKQWLEIQNHSQSHTFQHRKEFCKHIFATSRAFDGRIVILSTFAPYLLSIVFLISCSEVFTLIPKIKAVRPTGIKSSSGGWKSGKPTLKNSQNKKYYLGRELRKP